MGCNEGMGTENQTWTGQVDQSGQDSLYIGDTDGKDVRFWCIENQRSWPKPVRWVDPGIIQIDCGAWNWWRVEIMRRSETLS